MAKPTPDPIAERGLPANVDAEKSVLGGIIVNPDLLASVSEALQPDSFSLQKHQTIYRRMLDLHERSERVDRVTLANELIKHGQLESVDGLTYLVSLDDGMPEFPRVDGWVRIILHQSRLRKIIYSSQAAIDLAMSSSQDPESIASGLIERMSGLEGVVEDGPVLPGEFVEAAGGLDAVLSPQAGIPTGFHKFDEMLDGGGLNPGSVYVVGAESSRGKSAFCQNISMNLARRQAPVPVGFYSLEMGKRSLFHRAICDHARVSLWKFKHGYCNEEERVKLQRAASEVSEMPIYWDCRSGLSLSQLRSRMTKLKREKKIKLAVIDYLQIMNWSEGGKQGDIRIGIVRITGGIKELAQELKIPIILVSQVSRDKGRSTSKNPRPRMGDLRESSSIENDADAIAFIYRPEYDNPDRGELKGTAELIIAKQRDGPTGIIKMWFEGSFMRFVEEEPESRKSSHDGKAAAGGH